MTQPSLDDSDDERTVARPAPGTPTGRQDFVASSSLFGHTLPEGTRLNEFEVLGLIGEGGFGIVYLAYDPSLERRVAVKEYMPSSLASRANGSATVAPRSDRHADTFRAGLKSFVNEARLLARFDHAALVKVYRFWEANGTAYMVMPYYQGPTLKRALADMRHPPSELALRSWLAPLLDALGVMHAAHCFHRDIAPDNILLTDTGPLLLDFGAARRVVGDMTHALTVVLKPGYAPIEQYGDSPTMTQGAWTDLYALGCVVRYAITGKTPPSSIERLMGGDRQQPLHQAAAGRYSESFLRAIDNALAVQPQDRPQSVAEFRALLDAGTSVDLPITTSPAPLREPATEPAPVRAPQPAVAPAKPLTPLTPVTQSTGPDLPPRTQPAPASAQTWMPIATDLAPAPPPPSRSRRPAAAAGIGLTLACVLAVVAWHWDAAPPAIATTSPVLAAPPHAPAPIEAPAVPVALPTPAAPAEPAVEPAVERVVERAVEPMPEPVVKAAVQATPAPAPVVLAPAEATPPAKPRRDAAARIAKTDDVPRPTVAPLAKPTREAHPPRCTEILQKASLESLSAEEARFLKKECQ